MHHVYNTRQEWEKRPAVTIIVKSEDAARLTQTLTRNKPFIYVISTVITHRKKNQNGNSSNSCWLTSMAYFVLAGLSRESCHPEVLPSIDVSNKLDLCEHTTGNRTKGQKVTTNGHVISTVCAGRRVH